MKTHSLVTVVVVGLISSVLTLRCASQSEPGGSSAPPATAQVVRDTNSTTPLWKYQNVIGTSRAGHSAVYDDVSNRMIVFGGTLDSSSFNDVKVLENANGKGSGGAGPWITLIPNGAQGSPPQRSGHSAVFDSVNNRMIVFGGCPVGVCFNDVWVLADANGFGGAPTWQQLFPTGGPPPSRISFTAVYDQSNNRMIIFAGLSIDGVGSVPDVWVLSHANGLGGSPIWTQLSPLGGPPLGQIGYGAIYDEANNILIVFGGLKSGENALTNAVWTLSNANGLGDTPRWANLIADGSVGSPSKRYGPTTVYDKSNNRMIIFGGCPCTANNSFSGKFSDTWVLANANGLTGRPSWTKLGAIGAPPTLSPPTGRSTGTAIFDQQNNIMTIYGGAILEAFFNDVWTLTHANGL